MKKFIDAIRTRLGLLPTADKAIAGLNKALTDLREVANREAENIATENRIVASAKERMMAAENRMVRADRIADRIEGLVA